MKNLLFTVLILLAFSCTQEPDSSNTKAIIQFSTLGTPVSNARITATEGITPMEVPKCDEQDIANIFMRIYIAEDTTLIFANRLQVQFFPSIGAYQAVIDNIKPGNYLIGDLIALDRDDNPIFAVPHTGTQYAKFVSKPAMIPFTIINGEKTKVTTDVICVESEYLPLFGVQIFEFDIISLFRFGMFANYCDSTGHHKANLYVWTEADQGPVLSEKENGINIVLIPDHWNIPDTAEQVTVTAWIQESDTWLQATKSVHDWRDMEGYIYHIYYDCKSPLWCSPIEAPDNAAELLSLIQ